MEYDMDYIQVKEKICKYSCPVEVVKPEDEVCMAYGLYTYSVSKEQIEALLNGNALYLDIDGEYAALVHLKVKGDGE